MSHLALGATVILAVLVQAAVAPRFSLLDIKPDLLLILMAAWGTARGPHEAVTGGSFGGILADILSGAPLGVTAIALLPISLVAGLSRIYLQGTHPLVLLAIAFCGTFLYYSIFLLVLQAAGSEVDWLISLSRLVAPAAILNSLLSLLPFWVLGRFSRPAV